MHKCAIASDLVCILDTCKVIPSIPDHRHTPLDCFGRIRVHIPDGQGTRRNWGLTNPSHNCAKEILHLLFTI